MKFLTSVLLAALAGSSEAAKLPQQRRSGGVVNLAGKKVNRAKLMSKAIRVDKKTLTRKLDENGFEVTGDYSIQFNQCISLKTQAPDEDYYFGDLYQYTSSGQVVAEKSYVLFNLCETQYCSYEGEDEDSIYMVDLATYMGSLIEYKPNQNQGYCEACQEAQDYCQGNGEEEEEEEEEEDDNEEEGDEEEGDEEEGEDEEGEEDDEDDRRLRKLAKKKKGRKLSKSKRRKLENNNNYVVVDCNTCAYKNCFEDEDEDNDNGDDEQEVNEENTVEWVADLLECQQSDNGWNNFDVYTGFICNDAGTGVEIGVFMDEDCETYASMINYKNIVGDDDSGFFYNSQDIVTYPFLNDISCAADPEYITPEEYEEMQEEDNNEDEDNDEDEDAEANEYCGNLMGDDALPLYDCNEDGEEDEQDDEVEEEGDYNYDWYSYFLSQDDAEDNQAVCKLIQTLEGEYTVVYNSDENEGSGSFYNYGTKGSDKGGFGASNTLLLIIAICVGLLALYFVSQTFCSGPTTKRNALLENRHS